MHLISLDPTRVRPAPSLFLSPTRLPISPNPNSGTTTLSFSRVRSGSKTNLVPSLSLLNLHKPHVTTFPMKSTDNKTQLMKTTHFRTETKLYGHSGLRGAEEEEKKAEVEVELKWGLVKKVYSTLMAQVLLTTLAYVVTTKNPHFITLFQANSPVFHATLFTAVFSLVSLFFVDSKTHLMNICLLGLLSISVCVPLGVGCASFKGKIVLQLLLLTSAVVSALTGYTFWASKKSKDFSYLVPFLLASLIYVIVVRGTQMFYPVGSSATALSNSISAVFLSAWFTHDTHRLLDIFAHDEYVKAATRLFIDTFLIFINVMIVMSVLVI